MRNLEKNTKILLDTNILLDYFLGREPHFTNADRIMMLCRKHEISACIAGHSILNMYFILRKDMSDEVRRIVLTNLIKAIPVIPVDYEKILHALQNTSIKDFEDGVQIECAMSFGADYIVTRNSGDFITSKVKVITPEEFLRLKGGEDDCF